MIPAASFRFQFSAKAGCGVAPALSEFHGLRPSFVNQHPNAADASD
jgi:hypothetical protein